jgi:hypothetical protein
LGREGIREERRMRGGSGRERLAERREGWEVQWCCRLWEGEVV